MSDVFTDEHVPEQSGRVAVITGGNSGLGLNTAKVLAARGARVVVACRNKKKAEDALAQIRAAAGEDADVRAMDLDLSRLASVRAFADAFLHEFDRLDLLVNNAGLMAIPQARTADGFEMQIGVNHFGHFALTARLLPLLLATPGSRVVTVSSGVHQVGKNDLFDDLDFTTMPYTPWVAYFQSKLANLHFAFELARRLHKAGSTTLSVSAHPGYAATELQTKGAMLGGSRAEAFFMTVGNVLFAQSGAAGAWPQLRAATDPKAINGDFFGPDGLGGMRGPAIKVEAGKHAYDPKTAKKLWDVSAARTGEIFRFA